MPRQARLDAPGTSHHATPDAAPCLGVSTSGIAKTVARAEGNNSTQAADSVVVPKPFRRV